MPMDPVKLALEEIRSIEQSLNDIKNTSKFGPQRAEAINILEIWLGELRATIPDLQPTSAIGAAELIKTAISNLPATLAYLSPYLEAIATRMAEGERRQGDIIWLRAVATSALNAPEAATVKHMLKSAIFGATKPILIYRATGCLTADSQPWKTSSPR